MMTNEEKAFLDKLIEIGTELLNEAKKANLLDEGRYMSIIASPQNGYVSVDITKDGILKNACVFREYPDPQYMETDLNE